MRKGGFLEVYSEPCRKSVEISCLRGEVLNFLLAIYIFFSMIESVESGRDIPSNGDGNSKYSSSIKSVSGRDIPSNGDGNTWRVGI